jgi:hypothetical protein
MCCLVRAGKHVNDIPAIARQPFITTIAGQLEAVFSVVSAPRLYGENPRQAERGFDERPSIFIRGKPLFSSERVLHKDYDSSRHQGT